MNMRLGTLSILLVIIFGLSACAKVAKPDYPAGSTHQRQYP